ncbi:MAG TPA: helix-turn-helix domain-containing protein [Gemmatimonadales bacterium]
MPPEDARRTPGSTAAATGIDAPDAPDAPTRILQSATRLLAERGVARFNLQDVAEAAAVSKGLIHYHYHDKDTLLTRLVESLAVGVVGRQAEALEGADPATAVDALWTWLRGELRRGHLRVLQELAQEPGPLLRNAVHAAAHQRRVGATATLERLFARLGLRSRVPTQMLAEAVVAFEDGLVLNASIQPEQDPRVVFDVFWLAVLGLAE